MAVAHPEVNNVMHARRGLGQRGEVCGPCRLLPALPGPLLCGTQSARLVPALDVVLQAGGEVCSLLLPQNCCLTSFIILVNPCHPTSFCTL